MQVQPGPPLRCTALAEHLVQDDAPSSEPCARARANLAPSVHMEPAGQGRQADRRSRPATVEGALGAGVHAPTEATPRVLKVPGGTGCRGPRPRRA